MEKRNSKIYASKSIRLQVKKYISAPSRRKEIRIASQQQHTKQDN